MGDGVSEWTEASVEMRIDAGSIPAMGAFFFWQSRCPERVAAIPHPGMADTYGCLLDNSAKHKKVFLQPYPQYQKLYSTIEHP